MLDIIKIHFQDSTLLVSSTKCCPEFSGLLRYDTIQLDTCKNILELMAALI